MTLKRTFWILAAVLVPTLVALARIDADLRTLHAPHGIISFEFCGFAGSCTTILEEWGEAGRAAAMLSLGLDYLFMLAYAGGLWVGLIWSAEALAPTARRFVQAIALGAVLAGLADAAENYSLIQVVLGVDEPTHGLRAGVFATIKFVLVAAALLVWAGLGIRRGLAGRR